MIPESQLQTWSHQGAVTTAKNTRAAIYRALNNGLGLNASDYEVYLQGSYGNDTNIRADSDVDVIAQLNTVFLADYQWLDFVDAQTTEAETESADYGWADFRDDVFSALQVSFGSSAVKLDDKCIKVRSSSSRLPADVVAAIQLRRYYRDSAYTPIKYVEGIVFYSRSGHHKIINFPKQHYANGVEKMKPYRTNDQFKPVARVFKNIRNRMIDSGYIGTALAPSYFLQCWVYNAPDPLFSSDLQRTVKGILDWYWNLSGTQKMALKCQNEQEYLFGPGFEQWDRTSADVFTYRTIQFWNDWR